MTKCLNNTTTTEPALRSENMLLFRSSSRLIVFVSNKIFAKARLFGTPRLLHPTVGGGGQLPLRPPYPLVTPLYPHTANKMPKHCTSQTHDVYDTCLTAETKIKTQKINQHCQRKQTND